MKEICVVENILRSMPKMFNSIVISIEESQCWENVTIELTMGTYKPQVFSTRET